VITVVLNTEHGVHYFRDAPGRAHSRSSAMRIAEVENPGRSDERESSRARTVAICGVWKPGGG
jgi:hypothetical protein